MKKFFYLHGLPRAGNTLLGSIINQNPKVAVTANSIIADMLGELYSLKNISIFKNFPDHKSFDSVTKSLFDNYYRDWPQDYIIDRAPWGMPINLKFLKEVQDEIKIIVMVRDVEEILASFIKWSQREPTSFVNRYAAKTVEEKCDMLMNTDGQIVKELIGIKHLLFGIPLKYATFLFQIGDFLKMKNQDTAVSETSTFSTVFPFWMAKRASSKTK